MLAGSCSRATLGQVARASEIFPSYRLDPAATPDPAVMLDRARSWLREHWGSGPLLMYSSATPAEQEAARAAMGPRHRAILEEQLGELARDASGLGAAGSWSRVARPPARSCRRWGTAVSSSWARRTAACRGVLRSTHRAPSSF